jgi:hypothetical protein
MVRVKVPFLPNVSDLWFLGWVRVNRSFLMLKQALMIFVLVVIGSTVAEARHSHLAVQAPGCNVTMPCDFSFQTFGSKNAGSGPESQRFGRRAILPRNDGDESYRREVAAINIDQRNTIGGRPAGCPHSFCGCGASIRVFGRILPGLNLAANWLRFPRTSPAPGMVAARRGHVFVLEQHLEGDMWMAYDANSGGHATRIHARSLRGYTVVNPHARSA